MCAMALCSVPVFAGVAPDASASKAQTTVLQQNNKVVKGHIVDESGEHLIGVSVKELGTNNGAVTDIDGNFTLNGSGKNLEITYIGFQKQVVRPQGSMNIVLKSVNRELNEVVVVGYGVQKKVNLTGSVASVDMGKEALSRPTQQLHRPFRAWLPVWTFSRAAAVLTAKASASTSVVSVP